MKRQGSTPVARALPLAAAVACLAGAGAAAAAPPRAELISRGAGDGPAANAPSLFPAVSGNGRFVAFRTDATNLDPADTDTHRDVYVRDRISGALTLVSRASGPQGEKGDRASFNPRISADGRYVAFRSNARNLDPDDSDNIADVFVRDLHTQETTLVSRGADGAKGNGGSFNPSLSADGRRVAFRSEATNLHPADADADPDVYVRDLADGTVTLASRASGPEGVNPVGTSQFPAISDDGNRVAFRSDAPGLHPDDPDSIEDIFVRDLNTHETILVSRAAGTGPKGDGRSTFATLSADGRFAAFDSLATNLHPDDSDAIADVFVRDLSNGKMTLVSRASGKRGAKARGSAEPSISADGRMVAFHSIGADLDPADPDRDLDVFVRDLRTHYTAVLSAPVTDGASGHSFEPVISADGRIVVFHSGADDLSDLDAPGVMDVFATAVPEAPRCFGRLPTDFAVPDTLTRGSRKRDVIIGLEGGATIRTGKGGDLVCAGSGDDVIRTGRGADRVKAGAGDDEVRGGRGRDRLAGNAGHDRLRGGAGPDRLTGGPGRDRLHGGRGRDRCLGGSGKDRFKGCERVRR